jgi:hypothetical protein
MLEVPITADTLSGFGCTMVLVGIMVQSTTEVRRQVSPAVGEPDACKSCVQVLRA